MPTIEIKIAISGKNLSMRNAKLKSMRILGMYISIGSPTKTIVGINMFLKIIKDLKIALIGFGVSLTKTGITKVKTDWIIIARMKFKTIKIGPSHISGFKNKSFWCPALKYHTKPMNVSLVIT
jgi:hypothetical protein